MKGNSEAEAHKLCLIHPSHSEGVCAECECINHKGRMLRLPSQKLAPDEHEKQLYNGHTRLPAGELKQLDCWIKEMSKIMPRRRMGGGNEN